MKRAPSPRPEWIETCSIEHASGNVIDFPMVQDLAALLWVVNLGCIDLNQWYARCDDVDRPDYLHFDLDPVPRRELRRRCSTRRSSCARRSTRSACRATRRRRAREGIHVYVPIVRGPTQKQVWTFAKAFAQTLAAQHPEARDGGVPHREAPPRAACSWTTTRTRGGARSPRSTPCARSRGATVSTPVTWEEVERGVAIEDFRIGNVPARVDEGRRPLEAAARRAAGASGWRRVPVTLPIASAATRRWRRCSSTSIPRGAGMAVRAQVGRLPLPRLPRRRRGRAAVEGGKPLARYFPEIVEAVARAAARSGSCSTARSSIPSTGALSFDDLLQRIHPAESRVAQARRGDARRCCIVFDLLVDEQGDSRSSSEPLAERRARLEAFAASVLGRAARIRLSPVDDGLATAATAGSARPAARARRRDREAPRPPVPVRRARRDAEDQAHAHGRLRRRRVPLRVEGRAASARCCSASTTTTGCCTTSASLRASRPTEKPTLLAKARAADEAARLHRAARRAGPSRWSTERSERVGAARARSWSSRCGTTTSRGGRFRHGTKFLRWRPDKAPRQCTIDQDRAGERRLADDVRKVTLSCSSAALNDVIPRSTATRDPGCSGRFESGIPLPRFARARDDGLLKIERLHYQHRHLPACVVPTAGSSCRRRSPR